MKRTYRVPANDDDVMNALIRITAQLDNMQADIADIRKDVRQLQIDMSDVQNTLSVTSYALSKHIEHDDN